MNNYEIQINEKEDFFSTFDDESQFNTDIILADQDKDSKIKIYCKESYAQEMYDMMNSYHIDNNISLHANKDLNEGQIYKVNATSISFEEKVIYAYELNSKSEISISFKEFTGSIDELARGENTSFSVMIIKDDNYCNFIGSEKRCAYINDKNDIFDHFNNRTWFEVTIKKLIKGGYVAVYKDNVDCFIPGSHAGANVIRDFSKLLGKTINVMVDNYDSSNDLFILSYKKYIAKSMPQMISNLQFGNKYTGTVTNKPYDFGVFVEFEGYYTGLIHSSEFKNYAEIKNKYKAGDEIDFYIKNVTKKNNQYRIVLTLDESSIDSEKRQWDALRIKTENKTFDYDVDSNNNSIKIHIDGESYRVTLRRNDLQRNLDMYPKVKVSKVDPINKSLKFEFVEN